MRQLGRLLAFYGYGAILVVFASGQTPNSPSSADATKQAATATTAANRVEQDVSTGASLLDAESRYQKVINDITATTSKRNQAAIDDLRTLQAAVAAVQQADLINALTKARNSLDPNSSGSDEASRQSGCSTDKLKQPANGDQQDVTDALALCGKAQQDANAKLLALGTSVSNLQSALQSIYSYAAAQLADTNAKLQSLSTLASAANPDSTTILRTLPSGLPTLREILANAQDYQSTWKSIKAGLKLLGVAAPAASVNDSGNTILGADDQIATLQKAVNSVSPALHVWFPTLTKSLQDAARNLDASIPDLASDPRANSAKAFGDVRDQTDTLAQVQSVIDAWPPLVGYLVDGKPTNFDLKTTKKDFELLQTWANSLRGSISRVHDALAGDVNQFIADQVPLYYFTDVHRLMQALNERTQTIGGVAEAQANAAAQRTALTQTELDLADAQATVNRFQKQVLDLQEQQRQAQAKLKALDANFTKMSSRLKNAQDSKQAADQAVTAAQADQNANPNDPTKAAAVDKAKTKQTAAATKVSQAQSDSDAAKTERDNAQNQMDNAQNQKDSLPAKLTAAQQALSDAQTAVSQERRKMLVAAQAESDAFAFARDNAPFLYAPADAASSDPAKRVMLYAFNDSKVIFVRGMPEDLLAVKKIIAKFDQPAPQARLTLWTFQLNADSGQKTNRAAAEQLNRAMEIVDEELSDTRALENTTVTLLRSLINDQVSHYPPATPAQCPQCSQAELQKLGRLSFYDPLVLRQLNVDPANIGLYALRWLVPDPAGTTTLGEALMVLSLAPQATRAAVRDSFEAHIQERLQALPLSPKLDKCAWFKALPGNPQKSPSCQGRRVTPQYLLPLTWHALDIWEPEILGPQAGLNSSQLEITRALESYYATFELNRIADQLAAWRDNFGSINKQLDDLKQAIAELEARGATLLPPADQSRLSTLQNMPRALSGQETAELQEIVQQGIKRLPLSDRSHYDQQDMEQWQLQAQHDTLRQESVPLVEELQTRFRIAISDISSSPNIKETLSQLLIQQGAALGEASPRQAAADEMLKQLIIAIEDDLDRVFVQPMIGGLRTRLISETSVRVGILERESMLATNRGKARVDPRASAQLAVGTEQDILSSVQQLAQLYTVVQSGGALAALGALQQQPHEQQPEIYALTTGQKFEVTPIFDPSGQALRFKFDFVGTTNLQEPNGTTNPQLPRVERHTVNTEVQLSNLETREISRFESNARLGLPTRYSGGIPVLKDIPYVRPWVPLVGWFVRKAGSNGSAQQSVIFGQTTIYPTIGTLVNLLRDAGFQGGAIAP